MSVWWCEELGAQKPFASLTPEQIVYVLNVFSPEMCLSGSL